MDRKTSIVLVLLLILIIAIVTVNAGTQIIPSFRFPVKIQDPPPFIGWLPEHDSILVTHAPDNIYWSSIDPLQSDCQIPTAGPILAGDRITNCYGEITLRWIHGNYLIGKWEFSEREKPDETEPQDTPTADEPPEEILPTIKIIKPSKNALYVRNLLIKSFSKTVVIGQIDVEAKVSNPDNIPITGVKFYIDGEIKCYDTLTPYVWRWNEKTIGKHTITVEVCSETDEELASSQITVSTLNLKIN